MSSSAYLSSSDPALVGLDQSSFSMAFWFQPQAVGPTFVPVTAVIGPDFKVVLNSSGTMSFTILHSPTSTEYTVTSSVDVVGQVWNHIAVVYDTVATTITIYVNGVATSTSYGAAADATSSSYVPDFRVGSSDQTDGSDTSAFAVDSFSVWARALLVTEVASLYNSGDGLDYPFIGGSPSLVFQGLLINNPSTPLLIGTGYQLWDCERTISQPDGQFIGTLTLLYSGEQVTRGYRWVADNFYDKIIVAQHDNPAQYWTPPASSNIAYALPGLPVADANWDGVCCFYGHVLLWKDDRLKWSDKDDFTNYIPVGETAVSAVLNLNAPFIQPAPGGTVTLNVTNVIAAVASVSLSGTLSFPSTAVGSSSQIVASITNSGTTDLVVTGVSASPASEFSVSSFAGTIPAGGSVPVTVTFTPTSADTFYGTVTVASNATSGTSSLPCSGTGTGSAGVVALSGNLSFGSNFLNKAITSSLVISNTGNASVTITGITVPTGYSGSYSGTISAGASADVAITFTPTAKTAYNGSIIVTESGGGTTSYQVSGVGVTTGLAYSIFLTDNGSCQFGKVGVSTPVTGTLRVYNNGANSFKVIGVTCPTGFTSSFSSATQINAHAYHDFTITFTPSAAQAYGGNITVTTNQSPQGVNTLAVSGTGVASGKVISLTGSLDFGSVPVSGTAYGVLNIANTGDTALTVTSVTYPSAEFTGAFAGVVGPGKTQTVLVKFVPSSATTFGGTITVASDKTSGTNTISCSGTGAAVSAPEALTEGQFVTLSSTVGGVTYYSFYTVNSMSGSTLTLQLMDLTGPAPVGSTVPAGTQIYTLDANEAGETRVSGSLTNGPIFRVLQLGDYSYVMKERSISSMQYTGAGNGVFFIHTEVQGEGPIARDATVITNDGRIVFLGHKELFQYQGGPNLQPICQQYTRQVYRELDRTRLYQVLLFHYEIKNEIWVQYPVQGGGVKVLIWNYVEDTASIDDYDPQIAFTCIGFADWTANPTWEQYAVTVTWSTLDPTLTWETAVGASSDHIPVFGSSDGNLRVWGTSFTRDGKAYYCLSETMDYDCGECDIMKYVDVVVLGLQVRNPTPETRVIYVQVGGRTGLSDDNIVWSAPQPVLVNGLAPSPVKVNPGGAGRYLRLRFYSQDPNVEWRVSSFEIHCRPGGWY